MSHYLILEVLCPIFLSLLISIFGSNRASQYLSLIGNLFNIFLLLPIFEELNINNEIIYLLGGYQNSFGIELKLNFYSFIFLFLFNISTLSINIYKLFNDRFSYLQNSLFLLSIAGFNGIIMSNDLFNIYVFLEVLSISSYALISSFNELKLVKSAFSYLIFGTIGASFYLTGIAFLYMLSGTFNITKLLQYSTIFSGYSSGFLWLASFFITIGLIIKLGLFPVHSWLFKIYKNSPTVITSFLAFSSSTSSLYILTMFLFNIFDVTNLSTNLKISELLQIIGLISAIFFSFLAWISKSNKDTLIYSSLSQNGYIINSIGLISDYRNKLAGIMIIMQIMNNFISKPGLFMLFSNDMINSVNSKIKRFFHFTISSILIFSLMGIPPFLGFFGKFNLMIYIVEEKHWINLIMVLIATLFSCLYGVKLLTNLNNIYHHDHYDKDHHDHGKTLILRENHFIELISPSMVFCVLIILSITYSNQLQDIILLASDNILIRR